MDGWPKALITTFSDRSSAKPAINRTCVKPICKHTLAVTNQRFRDHWYAVKRVVLSGFGHPNTCVLT